MNSLVKVRGGKTLTMPEFAEKYQMDPENTATVIAMANVLYKQGKLTIKDTRSKDEIMLEEALTEETYNQVVDNIIAEEEAHKVAQRQKKLEETDSLKIGLEFATSLDAAKFTTWLQARGINEISELRKNGTLKLIIENITPQEYSAIARQYQTEKAINKTVDVTGKVVNGTTNAANFALTEVAAPIAKLTGEASMNLAKGLFHTFVKTGAGLVNSGARAIVDTKQAIATDAECLKASQQLLNAKNTVKRGVIKKVNQTSGSGIEILS
jgi:hypothetical protein